jgi:hypothetical protein
MRFTRVLLVALSLLGLSGVGCDLDMARSAWGLIDTGVNALNSVTGTPYGGSWAFLDGLGDLFIMVTDFR